MPRKVTLPGSNDSLSETVVASPMTADVVTSRSSGRVRHEDKITVYVSRSELLRLEQARLTLRADHGLAIDRGRIVREAVAAALDDFDAKGPHADLLRRLAES